MDFLRELFGQHQPSQEPARCPQCHLALENIHLGEVPVQCCGLCNGVWLSLDDFERIPALAPEHVEGFLHDTESSVTLSASVSPRQCPNCKGAMTNFLFREKVWLDWCPEGHGMWLDQGELAVVHHIRNEAEAMTEEQKAQVKEQLEGLKQT